MNFDVRNRYTGDVQFTADIDCADDAPTSIKLGLAVRWAIKSRAYMHDANLRGANLYGANLRDANLRDANLRDANLRDANLHGAYMHGANLHGAYMHGADLRGANLRDAKLHGADLRDANLRDAYMRDAYMRCADLRDANLRDAYMHGADLYGAVGVISFGPIGLEHRIGYAVKHAAGPMIQLGCFWGSLDEAAAAIRAKYNENSTYENLVRAACAALD